MKEETRLKSHNALHDTELSLEEWKSLLEVTIDRNYRNRVIDLRSLPDNIESVSISGTYVDKVIYPTTPLTKLKEIEINTWRSSCNWDLSKITTVGEDFDICTRSDSVTFGDSLKPKKLQLYNEIGQAAFDTINLSKLEHLTIESTSTSAELRICGDAPELKELDINHRNLSMTLNAPKLETLYTRRPFNASGLLVGKVLTKAVFLYRVTGLSKRLLANVTDLHISPTSLSRLDGDVAQSLLANVKNLAIKGAMPSGSSDDDIFTMDLPSCLNAGITLLSANLIIDAPNLQTVKIAAAGVKFESEMRDLEELSIVTPDGDLDIDLAKAKGLGKINTIGKSVTLNLPNKISKCKHLTATSTYGNLTINGGGVLSKYVDVLTLVAQDGKIAYKLTGDGKVNDLFIRGSGSRKVVEGNITSARRWVG